MKAITANPETIREVFSKKYIIPDFQRPYSWDSDPCEKLWEDIIDFYERKESKEDKYFLGNIVINPAADHAQEAWEVVDGQQRLTTLLLLIKALHSRAGTVKALEECLRIKDPLTSELTDELRVSSYVISEDREMLHAIILGGTELPTSRLADNYRLFGEKIDGWWKDQNQTAEALNSLILTLLDSVVLLPIHCGSEDDALTIFETINNRGMSLSDADIFKAKLYHNIPKGEQAAFIEDWNNLEDDVCCKRCISNASNTTYSQLICGTNEMADERTATNGRIDLYSRWRLLHPQSGGRRARAGQNGGQVRQSAAYLLEAAQA